jgi:hypothetical protein
LLPLRLLVEVPRRSWKQVKRARAIGARCLLEPAGSCTATLTVSRAVAKRLQLKIAKRARTLRVGSGKAEVGKRKVAALRIGLAREVRTAIGVATRDVPLTLRVTGRATGFDPVTVTKKLTIRR